MPWKTSSRTPSTPRSSTPRVISSSERPSINAASSARRTSIDRSDMLRSLAYSRARVKTVEQRRDAVRALTFSPGQGIVKRRRPHGDRAFRSVSALQRSALLPRRGRWQHDDPRVSTLPPADHGVAGHLLDGRSLPPGFQGTQEQVARARGAARAWGRCPTARALGAVPPPARTARPAPPTPRPPPPTSPPARPPPPPPPP